MLRLKRTRKSDPLVQHYMRIHYSQPKGFVGRQIFYRVLYNDVCYGVIVGGSTPAHLAGRETVLHDIPLNSIVNNVFFHIEKQDDKYPIRNFAPAVLALWRKTVAQAWEIRYGDKVLGFDSLVELPRSGEIYLRDGWIEVGQTLGQTCKRTGGVSTDSWSGKRVWDTVNLRPKRVFCLENRCGD